ncbi:MAG: hypothetical protein QW734_05995 [Candidatus Bathyarchaeia archaeon]
MDEKFSTSVSLPVPVVGAISSLLLAYRIAVILTELDSKSVTQQARQKPYSYRRWQEVIAEKKMRQSKAKR